MAGEFKNLGISLIVIRSPKMNAAAEFYRSLGVEMIRHSHPPCGEHYACLNDSCLFEIYPARKSGPDSPVTIGFRVSDVEAAVVAVMNAGGTVVSKPVDTEFGRSATIKDLDGNIVLLMQSPD